MDRTCFHIAVHLLLYDGNLILLQKRKNTGYEDGKYGIVSGHLERGESVISALIREAHEETSIHIREDSIHLVHIMSRMCSEASRVDFFFSCKKWTGEIVNAETHKCDELLWCASNHLPINTIPYIVKAIEYVNKGIMYATYDEDGGK